MIVIPAIDLKDGKCVRLKEGKMDEVTIFSDDPLQTSSAWFSQGAELLHIVDLDGSVQGKPINDEIILSIAKEFSDKNIQVGGGIRDYSSAGHYIENGISKVIMGTAAVKDPEMLKEFCNEYPGKLILGVDSLDGYVRTDGWIQSSKLRPEELVKNFEDIKLAGLIYTDISRDGMMSGPNIEATLSLSNKTDIPVIASGGVSSLDHIKELASSSRINGVICGRALYEEEFTLKEAMNAASQPS